MRRMKITMIAAVSLDGKIARHDHEMTDWTSKEDKRVLYRELDRSDAVVVGRKTFEVARKPLSRRNCVVMTRSVRGARQKSPRLTYLNPARVGLLDFFQARGYRRVCVLGGSEVYTYFLTHGLLDDIYLTIEPVVFGSGVPLFATPCHGAPFRLVSVRRLNSHGTVILHYRKP